MKQEKSVTSTHKNDLTRLEQGWETFHSLLKRKLLKRIKKILTFYDNFYEMTICMTTWPRKIDIPMIK